MCPPAAGILAANFMVAALCWNIIFFWVIPQVSQLHLNWNRVFSVTLFSAVILCANSGGVSPDLSYSKVLAYVSCCCLVFGIRKLLLSRSTLAGWTAGHRDI